jgi:hypothetical protein
MPSHGRVRRVNVLPSRHQTETWKPSFRHLNMELATILFPKVGGYLFTCRLFFSLKTSFGSHGARAGDYNIEI